MRDSDTKQYPYDIEEVERRETVLKKKTLRPKDTPKAEFFEESQLQETTQGYGFLARTIHIRREGHEKDQGQSGMRIGTDPRTRVRVTSVIFRESLGDGTVFDPRWA